MREFRWFTAFLAASSLLLSAGCSSEARRKLGETGDGDCADGICGGGLCLDPAEDNDGDTLINGLEATLHTNPVSADSDNDGARDDEELNGTALLDLDGDGTPDVLESKTSDEDGDCLPDQFDPQNAITNSDLTGLVPIVCRRVGVCSEASAVLAVACPGGPGTAVCEYAGVPAFEPDEATCDGKDNDCDGLTDAASADSDHDAIADCVDPDDDADGQADPADNCPLVANAAQGDQDGDGLGDTCDAPILPLVTRVSPADTGHIDPTLIGEADANALVRVFLGGDCQGTPVATTSAMADGSFALLVPLASPSGGDPQRFHLDASNGALTSGCTRAPQTYVLDTLAPSAPTAGTFTPASPSSSLNPAVAATTEPGARVCWYTNDSCAGAGACTVAGELGQTATTLALPGPGAYALYATATDPADNVSACAAMGSYVVVAALLPNPSSISPPYDGASPGPSNEVTVYGCGDPTTSVLVWNAASGPCGDVAQAIPATFGGAPAGSRTCTASALFSARVPIVSNTNNTFQAQARGPGGAASGCVVLGAYLHDDTPPAAPAGTLVQTYGATRIVRGDGTTSEAFAQIRLYTNDTCTGVSPAAEAQAGPTGAYSFAFIVPANTTTPLSARAVDLAGNVSDCAALGAYTHDSVPPAPPYQVGGTASPGTSAAPQFLGCVEAAAVVRAFADPTCKTPLTAATVGPLGGGPGACEGVDEARFTLDLASAGGTTALYATTTDRAGHVSACTLFTTYVEDHVPPVLHALIYRATDWSADPAGGVVTFAPRGRLSEAGHVDFLRVDANFATLANGDCTGTSIGSAAAAADGALSGELLAPQDQEVSVVARLRDRAGNAGICSPAQAIVGLATVTAFDADVTNPYDIHFVPSQGRPIAFNLPDGDLYDVQVLPGTGAESGVAAYVFEGCTASTGYAVDNAEMLVAERYLDTVVTYPGGLFHFTPHLESSARSGLYDPSNMLGFQIQGQAPGVQWTTYLSSCGRFDAYDTSAINGSVDKRCADDVRCVVGVPSDCSAWAYDYRVVAVAFDADGVALASSDAGVVSLRDDAELSIITLPAFVATIAHTTVTMSTSGTSYELLLADLSQRLDTDHSGDEVRASLGKGDGPSGATYPEHPFVTDLASLPLAGTSYRIMLSKVALLGSFGSGGTKSGANAAGSLRGGPSSQPSMAQSMLVLTQQGAPPASFAIDVVKDLLPYLGPAEVDATDPDRPAFARTLLDGTDGPHLGEMALFNVYAAFQVPDTQATRIFLWTLVAPSDLGETVRIPELPEALADFRPADWLANVPDPLVNIAFLESGRATDYRGLTELTGGYLSNVFRDDLPRGQGASIDTLIGGTTARLTTCCQGMK